MAIDEGAEDEAGAADVDEVGAADVEEAQEQARAKRKIKKRGHKRKQSAECAPKARGRPRRGGSSTAVDKGLVVEIGAFMKQWAGKMYDKTQDTLHKGIPGMTPYWSRSAAGIKVPKQDGAGQWQACYFMVDVDKCCRMATNIFLSIKFQNKCAEEGAEWPESSGAGEYYGLLVRSAREAHRRL